MTAPENINKHYEGEKTRLLLSTVTRQEQLFNIKYGTTQTREKNGLEKKISKFPSVLVRWRFFGMKEEEEGDPLSLFRLEKCEFENWALGQEKEEGEKRGNCLFLLPYPLLPPHPSYPLPASHYFLGRGRRPKRRNHPFWGGCERRKKKKSATYCSCKMRGERRRRRRLCKFHASGCVFEKNETERGEKIGGGQ